MTTDQECIELALFAINYIVGPEEICAVLLVFGALPRPAIITPVPTQSERARLTDFAMKEVERLQASRRVSFGFRLKAVRTV